MLELIAVDETVKLTRGQMHDASQTVLGGTRVYTVHYALQSDAPRVMYNLHVIRIIMEKGKLVRGCYHELNPCTRTVQQSGMA